MAPKYVTPNKIVLKAFVCVSSMAHEVQHMNIRNVAFFYLLTSTEKHLIEKSLTNADP